MKHNRFTIVGIMIALFVACALALMAIMRTLTHPGGNYASALQSAYTECPSLREFANLFPSHKSFISYYDGSAGIPEWSGEIINDNVHIIASASISLSSDRSHVVSCGPMAIDVLTIARLVKNENGTKRIEYSGHRIYSFDEVRDILKNSQDESSRLEKLISR